MFEQELIHLIPNTLIDDFFVFGFVGGMISFLYYQAYFRNDPKNHISRIAALYGTFLAGCVGGLLAIVFDKDIRLSILVGFLHQVMYTAMLRSARDGGFMTVLKEILFKWLTGGAGSSGKV